MTDLPLHAPPSTPPPTPREAAAALIVATAEALLHTPYSEQSPAGSDGDGHDWMPGDPWPTRVDCSGEVVVCLRRAGFFSISNGNANDQWRQHLGGIVHPSQPLLPGDVGCFLGSDNTPGYAGHTGIVAEYDHETRTGLLLNAYDSERNNCEIPFNRDQVHNLSNGLGVVGFYRPANRVAA